MRILGIETSCDDTSAAIVENGRNILSNVVSSQQNIHKKYDGIVPELASREHIRNIVPVVDACLKDAGAGFTDMDAIAVTNRPGLIGSLFVGLAYAKAISYANNIPLYGMDHLEGHIFSTMLGGSPEFPHVVLIVSGGHTVLLKVLGPGEYEKKGTTRDDAAGEAFDKAAKILGLPYPGGPAIGRLSEKGNPEKIRFPRTYLEKGRWDFSFSGIKTAMLYFCQKDRKKYKMEDITASFQEAIVDVLVNKTIGLAVKEKIDNVCVTGGVAANKRLRIKMTEEGMRNGIRVLFPEPKFCTDNAAMMASACYFRIREGNIKKADLYLNAESDSMLA